MVSRREWLKWALALPATAAMTTHATAQASTQIPQKAAQYQDTPKNGQMCGMCKYYIAPGGQAGAGMMGGQRGPGMMTQSGTCQLVDGSISPRGWCALYAAIGT